MPRCPWSSFKWRTHCLICLAISLTSNHSSDLTPQTRRVEAERGSLKMTKDKSAEKILFDFTDPTLFDEEQAASWWESSDTVRWQQSNQTVLIHNLMLDESANSGAQGCPRQFSASSSLFASSVPSSLPWSTHRWSFLLSNQDKSLLCHHQHC